MNSEEIRVCYRFRIEGPMLETTETAGQHNPFQQCNQPVVMAVGLQRLAQCMSLLVPSREVLEEALRVY